jgi:AraC-like DNA-binding protein
MPAEWARDAAAAWEIATPSRAGRLPGLTMAGFRDRVSDQIDLRVVPFPAVTVAVDLGDGLVVVDEVSGRQHRGSVVVGLAPGSLRVQGRGIECLQMRLSPAAAHAVLGGSAELSGSVLALDDVWGHDAARTQEQLRAVVSWDDRFAIAETAIARRLEAGRALDPEVAFVWGQMETSRGQVRVDGLAADVRWSRKKLWSRFRSQIGLTPKRAAQLVRFDHAAHRLAAGERAALVAAESGYGDQSHLHRDAMAFAGVTPTAVAVAPWLAVDDIAWARPPRPPDGTSPDLSVGGAGGTSTSALRARAGRGPRRRIR